MKLGKKIAALLILSSTVLFAAGISNVSVLVDQINKTSDLEVKAKLLNDLEKELSMIDKKDLAKAKEVVAQKLKTKSL